MRSMWNTAKAMAQQAPPERNRWVDFLRAFSILAVVIGHWLVAAPYIDAAGEVQGQVDLTYFEQHTLGASNRLFHTSPATRFVPEQSYFRIAPLEAGASCESLIRDWGRATGTKAASG